MKKSHLVIALASVSIFVAGCASTSSSTSSDTQKPSSALEVPALKVSVGCGACEVKPNIPGLIIEGYNEAASKAGRKVSTTNEATVTIKEYTVRGGAARFLAGALAGKDEIKAVIVYGGKTYAIEDYYRNAWLGIEALAKRIGEMSYAELEKE